MRRLGALFVVICMVLIAASLGGAAYLGAGLSATEAMLIGIAVLTGLALYNTVSARGRGGPDFGAQMADLSRGTADLARQVAELGRRIEQVESDGSAVADRMRAVTAPLSAELGELGGLVKQLAESVAVHEAKLAAARFAEAQPAVAAGEPSRIDMPPATLADAPDDDTVVGAIRSAIEATRVDLYLQPIVTLPQRKVRYYEALTRLRTEDGRLMLPGEFLEPAASSNLLPQIDQMLLFRTVQVVRRLQLKNREIGVFCNISATTLHDPQMFPQMVQFLEANRALSAALVLEFRQEAWRDMGLIEQESLAAIRELGFRFCMDRVSDLRLEPKELGERGIRFVKVPAALMLAQSESAGSDIHTADLSDLLGRFGISLIADHIETESQVVDLLDFELKFGQGHLFSPPRPVRAEALQADEPVEPKAKAG